MGDKDSVLKRSHLVMPHISQPNLVTLASLPDGHYRMSYPMPNSTTVNAMNIGKTVVNSSDSGSGIVFSSSRSELFSSSSHLSDFCGFDVKEESSSETSSSSFTPAFCSERVCYPEKPRPEAAKRSASNLNTVAGEQHNRAVDGVNIDDSLSQNRNAYMTSSQPNPESEERKRIRRERNKAAAARCRQRRLDLTHHLTVESEVLDKKRVKLEKEVEDLLHQKDQLQFVLDSHVAHCRIRLSSIYHPLSTTNPESSRETFHHNATPFRSASTAIPRNLLTPLKTTSATASSAVPSTTKYATASSAASIPSTTSIPMMSPVTSAPININEIWIKNSVDQLDKHRFTGLTTSSGSPSFTSNIHDSYDESQVPPTLFNL